MPDPAPEPRARIPRLVVLVGWVSFFADVSSEMAYPLLPLFIVGTLGAPATVLGIVEGAAAGAVALLTAYSGIRSDRSGRRVPWVRLGYGLPVLGKALLAAATVWPIVLAGRLIDRVGKGIRSSPRDALIADASPPDMLGRSFGLHRAMDTAGALTGVLLSAGLLWALGRWNTSAGAAKAGDTDLRLVLGLSALLALASLGVTFFLHEPERRAKAPKAKSPRTITPAAADTASTGPMGLPWNYWRTVLVLVVFALANSSDAFLLLRAGQVGLPPWAVVLAYALYNLVYTLVSYPAGALSDRFGRWRIIAAGWTIYIVVYAGFALLDHPRLALGEWGVWPLLAVYGLYIGLTDGVGKALVAGASPPDRRGTALGVFYTISGLASLAGSVLAGALWDRVNPAAAFWAGSVLAAVALALIPIAARHHRA